MRWVQAVKVGLALNASGFAQGGSVRVDGIVADATGFRGYVFWHSISLWFHRMV
jgi:hypothetical protein